MALAHRTIVGGIQIDRSGNTSVMLKLLIIDGTEEFNESNYRFPIDKGQNVLASLAAVNTFLTGKGRQQIPAKAGTVIKNTLEACWAAMDA